MEQPAPPEAALQSSGWRRGAGNGAAYRSGLGRDTPPPQTTEPPPTMPQRGKTTEDNAGVPEKRMGEKPTP